MISIRTVAGTVPLSLADAKAHIRVDYDDDDALITSLAAAACNAIAEDVGRVLTAETWTVAVPRQNGDLILPVRPVRSITNIAYFDRDDAPQTATVSDFYLFAHPDRPVVRPKDGKQWPDARERDDAITLTLSVGLTAVPDELLAAAKLLLGHWYEHREAVATGQTPAELPMAVRYLCDMHRAKWVAA